MAGRGPAPKDPARRARRNRDTIAAVVLERRTCEAPELPDALDWHPRTRAWWQSWQDSAQASQFSHTDWAFLLDTALIHNALWRGDYKVAAELRLRSAKMGATPEDRARLRWRTEDIPPEAQTTPPAPGSLAKLRYGEMRVLDGGAGA